MTLYLPLEIYYTYLMLPQLLLNPPLTMSEARQYPLPQVPFYSVEYPGYVRPSSTQVAINNLGGQSKLDSVFRHATSKPESLLELSLRPNNPFAHHISGEAVATNNIVFKIVKRKRKNKDEGEYTIEAVGVTHKTVRFRCTSVP